MNKQTIQFTVQSKNGVVQTIGKSSVLVPKTNFCGNRETKWLEDKSKKKTTK